MAKKKKEETVDTDIKQEQPKATKKSATKQTPPKEEKKTEEKAEKNIQQEPRQKREPLLVSNTGDLVSHAHWYKPENSDQLFFTARINNVPLKPRLMSPEDVEAVHEK